MTPGYPSSNSLAVRSNFTTRVCRHPIPFPDWPRGIGNTSRNSVGRRESVMKDGVRPRSMPKSVPCGCASESIDMTCAYTADQDLPRQVVVELFSKISEPRRQECRGPEASANPVSFFRLNLMAHSPPTPFSPNYPFLRESQGSGIHEHLSRTRRTDVMP
jgi:hypothetical protein